MNSIKSWKKPTPEKVTEAVVQFAHAAHYRYFFDRLQNPEWITPLRKQGLFKKPPDVVKDEERGLIQLPPWPESRYLARMAVHALELVRDVIKDIPSNGNSLVYTDLAEAALAMPAETAATLIDQALQWSKAIDSLTLLPQKLAVLATHLADGGKTEEALKLAAALLTLRPDHRKLQAGQDPEFSLPPEPQTPFDSWTYEQILKEQVPALVKGAGTEVLDLLCDLLDQSIRFSQRDTGGEGPEDYSFVWRSAIEDSERYSEIKSLLVTTLRDAVEQIIARDERLLNQVIEKLGARRPAWRIFSRVALHLLAQCPNAPDSNVVAIRLLLDKDFFDDQHCRHEYIRALRAHFARLSPDHQQKILSWISSPPSPDFFKSNYKNWVQAHERWPWDKELTDDRAAQEQRRWEFDRLNWLGASLPESLKPRYGELAKEFPERQSTASPIIAKEFVGPSTPLKAAQLQEMAVEELVAYMQNWQPSAVFMGDSREGLARELTVVAANDPARFTRLSGSFKSCHPTYVRALLNGLRDAVGKGKPFDWEPVLDLCGWVLQQSDTDVPKETGTNRYWAEEDRDWSWTRNSIAYLLEASLSGDKGKIPFDCRPKVTEILSTLCKDSDPTAERETRQLQNNTPPSDISINATRGVAMNALVHYSLWARKHLEGEAAAIGFTKLPEAQAIFEEHLRIEVDPSLAIRSIYGRWFPWLHLLDPEWASNHANAIFPGDQQSREYCDAAWGTYLGFNPAYDNVFEALRPQYKLAVDRLGDQAKTQTRGVKLDEGLASHLMGMYFRGSLRLDDPLLVEFFAKARLRTRAYAIEVLGRWLFEMKKKEQPSAELLSRFEELWRYRLNEAEKAQNKSQFSKEMASFGWWFRSEAFNNKWALTQLQRALAVAEHDDKALERTSYAILDRLAELSAEFPADATSSLIKLASAKHSAWQIFLNREPIRVILSSAIAAGGEAAAAAIKLINQLGKEGNSEYRDLLPR